MKHISQKEARVLLATVFIVGACSIYYELLISTVSSYFLGSSVLHFSVTIGLFLFFMGVGSYLSKWITTEIVSRFILVELLLGLIGGVSVLLLFWAMGNPPLYYPMTLLLIAGISILIGLEIPLLLRLIQDKESKDSVASILSFDYFGALIASVTFPLLLLPKMGTLKTAILVGMINVFVAGVNLYVFQDQLKKKTAAIFFFLFSFLTLTASLLYSNQLYSSLESRLYQDKIIHAEQSAYQRIVFTKNKDDLRLYLDGNLQFSTIDEYRYHETLVHIPFAVFPDATHILLLGAGDGLAVREILKYDQVKSITVVDIDQRVTDLASTHDLLTTANQDAFSDPRVEVVNQDAFVFVRESEKKFDIIFSDLPDPSNETIGRLYTKEFYGLVQKIVTEDGVFMTQASSPFFAPQVLAIIQNTAARVFPVVSPIFVNVPSFGEWGFVLASQKEFSIESLRVPVQTRYIDSQSIQERFILPKDIDLTTETYHSQLDQVLVREYEKGFEYYFDKSK